MGREHVGGAGSGIGFRRHCRCCQCAGRCELSGRLRRFRDKLFGSYG